jgi:antirestriction protein ArdC
MARSWRRRLIGEEVMRKDIYQRVTDSIVAELERGVRPWLKPWNTEHAAGRITRPLRSNLVPYQGINVLMLWAEAVEKGFAAPIWMTFKQALLSTLHLRRSKLARCPLASDAQKTPLRSMSPPRGP